MVYELRPASIVRAQPVGCLDQVGNVVESQHATAGRLDLGLEVQDAAVAQTRWNLSAMLANRP